MDDRFMLFVSIFLFGSFLEAVLLVRHRLSFLRLLLLLSGALLGLLLINFLGFSSRPLILAVAAAWFLYFVFTLPFLLKIEILPVISRRTLLALTVIFWYLYFFVFHRLADNGLVLIAAIFSITIFVLSLSNWPLHNFWRTVSYAWFMCILIAVTIAQINFPVYGYFFNSVSVVVPGVLDVFIAGMAAFYLTLQFWNVLHLLPVSLLDKSRSTGLALWEWRAHLKFFSFKYHHEPVLIPLEAVLIAAATALALWLNNIYGWLPNMTIIDTLIVVIVSFSPQTIWAYH